MASIIDKYFYGPQTQIQFHSGYRSASKFITKFMDKNANNAFFTKIKEAGIPKVYEFYIKYGSSDSINTLKTFLENVKNFETLLLMHSMFIFTRAVIEYDNNEGKPQKSMTQLIITYEYFYNMVHKVLLVNREDIKYFMKPEHYKSDEPIVGVPDNILNFEKYKSSSIKKSLDLINQDIKIYIKETPENIKHPFPKTLIDLCDAPLVVQNCVEKFKKTGEINFLYKPVMDIITCFCSYFKHRIKKTSRLATTLLEPNKKLEMSTGDFNHIKNSFTGLTPKIYPIAVFKYVMDSENNCPNKTYLSQLFGKSCLILYKPTYLEVSPNISTQTVVKTNRLIESKKCGGYCEDGLLNVFNSSIAKRQQTTTGGLNDNLSVYANVQVYFILNDGELYYDLFSGPSFQFFNDVLKELLEKQVFIKTKTLFNNDRYELNMRFNIDTLESYKKLPEKTRTPELKKEVTEYFYFFLGNLIHFAIANNLILPFKLSRIYIMYMFSLHDFTSSNSSKGIHHTDIEKQMLLISIYLIEKASERYYNLIVKIFQNPELLKDIEVIQELDPELIDDVEDLKSKNKMSAAKALMENGVRMNGLKTLDKENKPIYVKDDPVKVLYNMIDYLYKTAYKAYFESAYEDNPLTPDFKINTHLKQFFMGFKNVKEFGSKTMKSLNTFPPFQSFTSMNQIFSIVRKADIYLSGFGITFETIRDVLIPKISAKLSNEVVISPLQELKKTDTLTMDYLKNIQNTPEFINITDPNKKRLILSISGLYRVLMSKGEYIPIDFINGYNEFMFKTKIPPYIVKATIKYNNRDEIKIPSGATVQRSGADILIITTTSDKRLIIPQGATVKYENTPVLSGYHDNMTPEDYHNEFVKYLLKFWSGSPNISDSFYAVDYYFEDTNRKRISAATCFMTIHIFDKYSNDSDLYKALANAIMHTGFGEMLGGSSAKNKKK
jgi:hypothetical protein